MKVVARESGVRMEERARVKKMWERKIGMRESVRVCESVNEKVGWEWE